MITATIAVGCLTFVVWFARRARVGRRSRAVAGVRSSFGARLRTRAVRVGAARAMAGALAGTVLGGPVFAVLGAIAGYLVFPIDIIPDFIPVLGQLDDLGVLIFGLDFFIRNAPPEVVEEHMGRIARNDDELKRDLERAQGMLSERATELRATLDRILSRDREGDNA